MTVINNQSPSAFICANKNRLKIYNDNTVFLKNKQNFSIELFNPTTKTIGMKILINGNSISNSLLVLKPGERSYLERYLDDNRKFLFETYSVENSKAVKEAIKNNGDVRVEFYNEKQVVYNLYCNGTVTISPPNPFTPLTNPYYYGTTINCSRNSGVCGTNGPSGLTGNSTSTNYLATDLSSVSTSCNSSNATFTSDTYFTTPGVSTKEVDKSAIETGRVEKGSISNQSFGNYYGDFEAFCFASVEYKLLPESQKPVEMKDIRNYCHQCNIRIRKTNWKYCSNCGTKLDI